MRTDMIELRRKKRAKKVTVQKENLPPLKTASGRAAE